MTSFAIGFVGGLAGWTLLEYAIHYWLGHLSKGRILISSEHLRHHGDILYFTPLPMKVLGALPVLALLFVAVGAVCGLRAGLGCVVAVSLGWAAYEWLHLSIHVHGPRTAYGRWAARHHLSHHFNRPPANHGVTTPIWDVVFRTHAPVGRVRIPKRSLPSVPWLAAAVEENTRGQDFLADYEVV